MVKKTSAYFQPTQVAPGEYKILAVDNPDELEYGNPEVVRKYLSKARDVSLVPNQKTKVELDVVHIGDSRHELAKFMRGAFRARLLSSIHPQTREAPLPAPRS